MNDFRSLLLVIFGAAILMLVVIVWLDNRAILSAPSSYETVQGAAGQRDIIERELAEIRTKANDTQAAQTITNKLFTDKLADIDSHLQDVDSDMAAFQQSTAPRRRRK